LGERTAILGGEGRQMYDDGAYLANNPSWHTENSAWKASKIREILARNRIIPMTICEVGCGAGEVLRQVHQFYPDALATGYEISPQAFEICKPKTEKNLDFRFGDLAATTETYEVLLALDVMEHVEDYIGFIRSLRRNTALVVFHIPLDLTVQSVARAKPLEHARQTVGHLHYFTKETAIATLKHAGYEVIDSFYTYLQLESPNRSLKIRLVAPFRRIALAVNEDLAVRFLGGCSLMVLAK
jgi:trans-aconitate methyltransferase